MHHTQIFDAMKGIVEAPGSPLLKRNQDDFYKHDHRQIEENWDHHARFLWAVGVNGTHLVRLGIHQRSIDAAKAMIESVNRDSAASELFLLTSKGVTKISSDRATREAEKLDYLVDHQTVRDANGRLLARFIVTTRWHLGRNCGSVEFGTPHGVSLTRGQKLALVGIAQEEVIQAFGSFWVVTERVTLNETDLCAELAPAAESMRA